MRLFALAVALLSVSIVNAATIVVAVGDGGGLTFTPNQVTAAVGDIVAFQFKAKNHSVTQSTFAQPCVKNGVDSGFFPVAAGATEIPQWSFTVNNASAPLWFFCAQNGHCGRGMVFAVNPTADKTFDAFQATANATGGATGNGTATTGTGTSATPSASAVGGDNQGANGALSRSSLSMSSAGLAAALGLILGVLL